MKKNSFPLSKIIQIKILLFLIIVCAFFVRFQAAQRYNIMVDEAALVIDSYRSFPDLFFLNYWNTAHPPLYDIINKITIFTQSAAPIDIRLKSQIFGALSLVFLFKIVFLITKSINTSFIAVILMIFSGFHVGLSAFNRPYGFQQFFVLGFLFYFLKIFLNQFSKTKKDFISLLIFSALATLTDYSFLWIIASVFIILTIDLIHTKIKKQFNKETLFCYLKISLLTILPFLFWLPIFIIKFNSAVSLESYLEKSLRIPAFRLIGMTVQNMFYIVKDDNFFIFTAICIVIFAFFATYKYIKSDSQSIQKIYLFLAVIGIAPLIISLIASFIISPVILSRNLFMCSYPYIIFLAVIISRQTSSNKINQIFLISTLVIFQYLNMHTTILGNSNFNHSNEVAQTRGIVFSEKLDGYNFVFDYSLPQSSWGVWNYYFDMRDFDDIEGIKRIETPYPKDDQEFILLSYIDPPKINKDIIEPYNCTNLKISLPKNIQLFKCILKTK